MSEFNEHIRNSFKDFSDEPDDMVWASLKDNLLAQKQQKRRKVFFVVLTGFIISSVVGFSVFGYKQYTISRLQGNTVASEHIHITQNAGTYPPVLNENHHEKNGLNNRNSDKVFTSDNRFKTEVKKMVADDGEAIVTGNTSETHAMVPVAENAVPGKDLEAAIFNLTLRPLQKLSVNYIPVKKVHYELIVLPKPQVNKGFVGITIMSAKTGRLLNGDPAIRMARKNEAAGNGFNFGFSAGKYLSENISLSSGLNVTFYKQSISHQWNEEYYYMDSMKVKNRNSREIYFYHYQDTAAIRKSESFTNRITYISLPINIQFMKPLNKRFFLYTSVGASLSYIAKASMNVNYENSRGLQIEQASNRQFYRRFGAAANIGCGLQFKLVQNFELSAGLHSIVSSNYFAKGKIKEYPLMGGLQIGIRKNF